MYYYFERNSQFAGENNKKNGACWRFSVLPDVHFFRVAFGQEKYHVQA